LHTQSKQTTLLALLPLPVTHGDGIKADSSFAAQRRNAFSSLRVEDGKGCTRCRQTVLENENRKTERTGNNRPSRDPSTSGWIAMNRREDYEGGKIRSWEERNFGPTVPNPLPYLDFHLMFFWTPLALSDSVCALADHRTHKMPSSSKKGAPLNLVS